MKDIDCLFIGHNEMDFGEFERTVRKMGVDSGAYRDLNLNFVRYENKPYSLPDFYNLLLTRDNPVLSSGTRNTLNLGETFSAAVAYLGTYLHRRGFTFDYVNSFQDRKPVLAEKLSRQNIRIVAIPTTLYVTALPIIEIVEFVKKYNPDVPIVIGGPFVSTQVRTLDAAGLEYLFQSIGADYYVNSSQGESALVSLLHALKNNRPVSGVNNLYYKTGAGYAAAAMVPENNMLSQNMVDWSLFRADAGEYVNVRTAISCPFSCAFCGFPEHAGKYQTTTAGEIEAELNRLAEIPTVRSIHFIDDTFNVPVKRFKEILRMLVRNKYAFKWHSHFRCQFADREMVELMKESGCEGVFLGLESGSPTILQNMNKAASIEKYHEGIALLKEYDITVFASFIIGFPGETLDTVKDTIRLIETDGIDFYRAQSWYCESITPIFRQGEKYGIKGENFEWSHDTMDSKTASQLVTQIFQTVDTAVWTPQYNFDFDSLFHLFHRGMTVPQVKEFLTAFNRGVREKLSSAGGNVSLDVIKQLLAAGQALETQPDPLEIGGGEDLRNMEVEFDF